MDVAAAVTAAAAAADLIATTLPTIRGFRGKRVETQEWVDALERYTCAQVAAATAAAPATPAQPSSSCSACHATHAAPVCPIQACVQCRFANVDVVHITPLAAADGAPDVVAAILSLQDRKGRHSAFQCGAVCLDRVPTADHPLRHMWILTPLCPAPADYADPDRATDPAESAEAVAWFHEHHGDVRDRMYDLCAAGGTHAVDEYIKESKFMDAFDSDSDNDNDVPDGLGAHPHFPLPRVGGEELACEMLLWKLLGNSPAKAAAVCCDARCDGESDEDAKGDEAEEGEAQADEAAWVLHYADRTTATPAWEAISVQRHRASVLRRVRAPPATCLSPRGVDPWCFTFADRHASMPAHHVVMCGATRAEWKYVDGTSL